MNLVSCTNTSVTHALLVNFYLVKKSIQLVRNKLVLSVSDISDGSLYLLIIPS